MGYGEIAGILSLQAILAGLAGWLGKVYAERIARREGAELQRQIDQLKAALDIASHISKAQYDVEFKIYRELWEKMLLATSIITAASFLKATDGISIDDDRKKALGILTKSVGEFGATVQNNRPFYSDSVFRATEPLTAVTSEALLRFNLNYNADEYSRWALTIIPVVLANRDSVGQAIRIRMKEISA